LGALNIELTTADCNSSAYGALSKLPQTIFSRFAGVHIPKQSNPAK